MLLSFKYVYMKCTGILRVFLMCKQVCSRQIGFLIPRDINLDEMFWRQAKDRENCRRLLREARAQKGLYCHRSVDGWMNKFFLVILKRMRSLS